MSNNSSSGSKCEVLMSRGQKRCDYCGDDYPLGMMHESVNGRYACEWCMGFDPMRDNLDDEMSVEDVAECVINNYHINPRAV